MTFLAEALMEAEGKGSAAPAIASARPTGELAQRLGGFRTRVGEVGQAIPRLRQGSCFLSFLEPRKVSERALVACVPERRR